MTASMLGFFITSCGTGRGKTFFAETLLRSWRAEGRAVDVLKPIVSGFDPKVMNGSDPARLLLAAGMDVTDQNVGSISPWRYSAPLSPDQAAALEGKKLPVDDIIDYCINRVRTASVSGKSILVEGAGGVMVPLDDNRTMRDLIRALDLTVILVVGSYLGSLSHTLTALESLRVLEIKVETLIVNGGPDGEIPVGETIKTLGKYTGSIPLKPMLKQNPAL